MLAICLFYLKCLDYVMIIQHYCLLLFSSTLCDMVWLKIGTSWRDFLSSAYLSIFVQSQKITISCLQNHLSTHQRTVNTLQVRIYLFCRYLWKFEISWITTGTNTLTARPLSMRFESCICHWLVLVMFVCLTVSFILLCVHYVQYKFRSLNLL